MGVYYRREFRNNFLAFRPSVCLSVCPVGNLKKLNTFLKTCFPAWALLEVLLLILPVLGLGGFWLIGFYSRIPGFLPARNCCLLLSAVLPAAVRQFLNSRNHGIPWDSRIPWDSMMGYFIKYIIYKQSVRYCVQEIIIYYFSSIKNPTLCSFFALRTSRSHEYF